jgi:GNAT superfamily N-acetyltransferase
MITIDILKNHPSSIPRLARIWYELIGSMWTPDIPVAEVEAWMNEWHNQDALPLAHIALSGNIPVGSCSLRVNDGIRPDLSPWLGELSVDSAYRNQGVGELLINATKDKARQLGFGKLYLFAFDPTIPDYYKRLGWNKIAMDEFKEHPVTVMEIKL